MNTPHHLTNVNWAGAAAAGASGAASGAAAPSHTIRCFAARSNRPAAIKFKENCLVLCLKKKQKKTRRNQNIKK